MTLIYIFDETTFDYLGSLDSPPVTNSTEVVPALASGKMYRWGGSAWVESDAPPAPPAPPVVPTLAVISVTGGTYDAALGEITVPSGTAITVATEVQVEGQVVTAYAGAFRVPVVASDGREKVLGATIVAGVAAITWTPHDSGIWAITQERINRDLPVEQHLVFAGLRVFVLE